MSAEDVLAGIEAEAERIRFDGSLPPDFEADLRSAFEQIAADPQALEAEVAARASFTGRPGVAGRLYKASAFGRRAASAGRRRVGPKVRVAERKSIEGAARIGEVLATGYQVSADRARRRAAGTAVERAAGRVSSTGGVTPNLPTVPAALRVSTEGVLGDEDLDRYVIDRLSDVQALPILHAEAGDWALVRRLEALGLDAHGADPRHGPYRHGTLEAIARRPKGSLGGIVLSGTPDRVTPARARALASLVASRLAPGGRVLLLSSDPSSVGDGDPVAADLAAGRPLHPVTWCHLFSRVGLEEITVREPLEGPAYVVCASSPGTLA